jgi:trigger factor
MQDNIKVQELSSTEYSVSINIPAEEVDKKFDEFFESIKSKTQVTGFRKGMAPVSHLRKVFGQKARAPVSQMLIGEYYTKLLKDHGINPVGQPIIKKEDLDPKAEYVGNFAFDNAYSVNFTIEVMPKIDPEGYKGLELTFPTTNEDSLIDSKLTEYREQFAERSPVTDRGAKLGDTIVVDFTGYVNGVAFDGGAAKGFSINKLGQSNFIPGFEEQIVGIKTGETKKITVTFPANYNAEHLAGKEATFDITVHNIVEAKLAEVNDDLAMMIGYQSVDELKAKVKEDVAGDKRLRDRQTLDSQIITKLLEKNKFDTPKSMVESELQRLLKMVKVEKMTDEFMGQLRKSAEYSVKRALIIDSIYEKEKSSVEITPVELNDMLDKHSQMSGKTKDELVSMLYNSGQMDNFVGVLRISKIIDFIIDNAKAQEREAVNG